MMYERPQDIRRRAVRTTTKRKLPRTRGQLKRHSELERCDECGGDLDMVCRQWVVDASKRYIGTVCGVACRTTLRAKGNRTQATGHGPGVPGVTVTETI